MYLDEGKKKKGIAPVEFRTRVTRQTVNEGQIIPPIDFMLAEYLHSCDEDADVDSNDDMIQRGTDMLFSDLRDASWSYKEADSEHKRIWISNISNDRFGFDDCSERSPKADDRIRRAEYVAYDEMVRIGATYASATPSLHTESPSAMPRLHSESPSGIPPIQYVTETETETEVETETVPDELVNIGHFVTNCVDMKLPALEWYWKTHGALYLSEVNLAKRLYEERLQ